MNMGKFKKKIMLLSVAVSMIMSQNRIFADAVLPAPPPAVPATPVYNCHSGDCCDCSAILVGAIDEIILQNRNLSNYSKDNFRDDVRMGIWKNITGGTPYNYELAKYELIQLMKKYLVSSKEGATIGSMWVEQKDADGNIIYKEKGKIAYKEEYEIPWTKEKAIKGFCNAYEEKFGDTGNQNDAWTQASNFWENNIVNYLDFAPGKQFVTLDDIQDIMENLGMNNMHGKNLQQMSDEIGHTHNKSKSGTFEECLCNHACSVNQRKYLNDTTVKVGSAVPGYSYYVPCEITSDDPDVNGILSKTINVGVLKIVDGGESHYVVGECVCRLGAKVKEEVETATMTYSLDNDTNVIQPQGLANISFNVTFNKEIKKVAFDINLKDLIDNKWGGKTIIDYDLYKKAGSTAKDKIAVTAKIFKTVGGTKTEVGTSDYAIGLANASHFFYTDGTASAGIDYDTFNPSMIKIKFAEGFVFEENAKCEVKLYFKPLLNKGFSYDDYTTNVNDNTKNTKDVKFSYQGEVKKTEGGWLGGYFLEPEYGTFTSAQEAVPLKYVEMAKIY